MRIRIAQELISKKAQKGKNKSGFLVFSFGTGV
jgi:hypothetical protein